MTTNTPAPADLVEAVIAVVRDQLMSTDYPVNDFERKFAGRIVATVQAHMASDGVVQGDRDCAAELIVSDHITRLILAGEMDHHPYVQRVAAHRRAAAVGKGEPVAWVCEADLQSLQRKPEGDDLSISPCPRPDLGMKTPLYATPQPDPRDAEIARLREAMAPFAKAMAGNVSPVTDASTAYAISGITIGDLRRARAALAKEGK